MERTFVMVKPNGVDRGLVGEVVARFERRGFTLRGMKALRIDRALAERHYAEHIGKPFFESLAAFITSGPVVAMVWEGRDWAGGDEYGQRLEERLADVLGVVPLG